MILLPKTSNSSTTGLSKTKEKNPIKMLNLAFTVQRTAGAFLHDLV